MIRLSGTRQTLQILLAGAVATTEPDVVCCFTDKPPLQPQKFLPGTRDTTTSGATAVDVCQAPENNTVREIDFLSLRNNDTASVTVTVRLNNNGTTRKIVVVTLLTLEQLLFTADSGWIVLDVNGNSKTSVSGTIIELDWTPTLTFATPGDLAVTYSARVGKSTKIGRLVHAEFNITTSAFTHTTASGLLQVTALPYTSNATVGYQAVGTLVWQGITKAGFTNVLPVVTNSATTILFSAVASASAATAAQTADVPTGGSVALIGSLTYIV